MEEELKAAEQYLSTGGKIQSPTSLLQRTQWEGEEGTASSDGLGGGG